MLFRYNFVIARRVIFLMKQSLLVELGLLRRKEHECSCNDIGILKYKSHGAEVHRGKKDTEDEDL
jgi:hypothetical protein